MFGAPTRRDCRSTYAPILAFMNEVLAARPQVAVLDLTELQFLNSSGINLLAKFAIAARKQPEVRLAAKGSARIPWQSKSLPNLKKPTLPWILRSPAPGAFKLFPRRRPSGHHPFG